MNQSSYKSNPNRSGQATENFTTSIDVGQWRQDVNAFAKATRQMLDSIHEELSNGLANGKAQVELVTHEQKAIEKPSDNLPDTGDVTCPVNTTSQPISVSDECDELLAKLKAQLSDQLNQST